MLDTVHAGRPIGIPDAPGGNDYRTTLLIQAHDGGGTTFTDAGHGGRYGHGHTVEPRNGARHGTAPGIGSYLDLSGGRYLEVPYSPDTDLNLLEEWTLDFWFYATWIPPASTIGRFMGTVDPHRTKGWQVYQAGHGVGGPLLLLEPSERGGTRIYSQRVWPALTWHHAAIVRADDRLFMFRNGKLERSVPVVRIEGGSPHTGAGTPTTDSLWIGHSRVIGGDSVVRPFYGYMREFRISTWPRWTADFTPSTTPYER